MDADTLQLFVALGAIAGAFLTGLLQFFLKKRFFPNKKDDFAMSIKDEADRVINQINLMLDRMDRIEDRMDRIADRMDRIEDVLQE